MALMSLLWAIAFGICPQRPSHSLFFGDQQMPIEARMAGMFGGFVIGAAYFVAAGRGRAWRMPSNGMMIVLVSFVALLGVDGLNAFFYDLRLPHLYPPNLALRLGTGLLTGLAFAGFLVPAFNSTVWQTGLEVSPLNGARDLFIGIAVEAVYFGAAFSGVSILLYPLSLIAVLGVPLLIGAIGSILLAIAFRKTNRATRLAEVMPLFLGGLLMAAGMLMIISGLRYALFGPGPIDFSM